MSTNQALATPQDWALQPMEAVRLHAPELVQHPSAKHWDNAHELVLITGGWSGISKEIALSLVKKGVRVVVLDIQEPAFAQAFYHADVTFSESIHAAATKIRAEHGHPTVLLNNANAGKNSPLLEKSEARFRQAFNYHGRVVAIASMTSLMSLGRSIDYCCSKASALAFHEGLRQELSIWYDAPKVRTSIFLPSWVPTPMTKRLTSAGEERFKQPLLEPEVVAEAVVKQVLAQRGGQIIFGRKQVCGLAASCLPVLDAEGLDCSGG
ncbi:short-chain dehydrogenase [Talaromyces pinophilus]|uniref:Short-chain dehydrogenase n=1 Tax=Talaromyces pinophilus TaxID=128442 RepID=A0A6V8H345_TALPI|nr:short-chain dehydrogenase [Talaromyces pinophilus]